jgi:hypothetical protein
MKRLKTILTLLLISTILIGCGVDLNHQGKKYQTVGIAHFLTNKKEKCVEYDFSPGNIFWGAILFPSVVAPVYFWGFSSMNPVSVDQTCLEEKKNELLKTSKIKT